MVAKGAERRQKSSAGSEREKVLQKEEGGGVKKSVEEKEKEKEKEKKGDKKKQKAIAMSVLSMQRYVIGVDIDNTLVGTSAICHATGIVWKS